MKTKVSLVLVLLILFSTSHFGWTGPACVVNPATFCLVAKTKPTVVTCGNLTTDVNCNKNFIPATGTTTKGLACLWSTGLTSCIPGSPCYCYPNGASTCPIPTSTNRTNCTAVPEFFGIEFGEMGFSTGIIALIAAIVLPSILFRKKK